MATTEQLIMALQRADAAGDVEAAKAIAQVLSAKNNVSAQPVQPQAEIAPTAQEPDFMSRVAQSLSKRGQQYKDIVAARDAEQQTDLESALQIIGKPIAGTVNDAIGGAIGLAGRGLSAITPDVIENPIVNAFSSSTETGVETAAPALQRLSEMYGNFAKESPRAARNIESIANIGMAAPFVKPAQLGAQATGQAAQAAGRATRSAILPTIAPEVLPLAKRAEEFGIPLRLDQVAPTRVRNTVQKVSQEVPFSGVGAFEDTQRAAWNKRLAQEIGGEGFEDLAPASVKKIVDRNSKEFDALLKDKTINVDNVFVEEIGRYANELNKTTSDEISKVVMRNIDELKADMAEGAITGERLASIRTKLINRQGKGEVSDKLGEVIGFIDDLAKRNLTPDEAVRLADIRKKYKYLKTVEPLLEKASVEGGVNPTQLLNRIAANPYIKASRLETGDDVLVDLARIGKEFLPTKGGSDTAQKAYLSGALGTGSVAGALTNLPLTVATLGGNRALQSLYNASQPMVRAAIAKSAKKQGR